MHCASDLRICCCRTDPVSDATTAVLCSWGNSKSPAYGEITDYYLASKQSKVR